MKNLSKQTGVAAVEFAILLIPLVFLVFGTTEFGRAIYQYNTLVKATRDAARFLSAQDSSAAAYPLADARCIVVYGKVCSERGTRAPLAPGLDISMVSICDRTNVTGCVKADFSAVETGSGVINLVQVKINGYKFTSLVPFVTGFAKSDSGSGSGTITFGEISTTMRQVL